MLVCADDDLAGTVRPRLDAAGAAPGAVAVLRGVRGRDGGRPRRFCLGRDLPALERAVMAAGSVRLVVIDPVTAYLGRGGVFFCGQRKFSPEGESHCFP